MVCLDTLTIWYNGGSGTYETPIQNPPCTSTTVREVLSQTTLSLDNCYSTSTSGDPLDLDGTWFNEVGFEPNPTIYKISCPEPVKPLYSHGHIDTLHMRHIQHGESYSAMRGPCAEGRHVPLKSEMQNLYNTWIALGGTKTDIIPFATAFKMPIAGYRQSGAPNQAPVHENMRAYYYSCMRSGINAQGIGIILDGEGYVDNEVFVGTFSMSLGNYVRPRKDTPVTPTSSWTKLYGTSISEGGIFWNSTEGLISFSSNGSSWTTIADKNLGATTAWDGSVSYTQANAGNMYQWGNCYGFPRTGDVATTGTVDASGYGPNNYYTSSTWAIVGGGTYCWESSGNTDLRGGATGIIPAEDYREPVYYGPQITLLSYEEIIAMAGTDKADDIVAVLNEHPLEYYNKLSSEGHLELDSYHTEGKNGYVILYTNNYIMYFGTMTSLGYSCSNTHIGYIPSTGLWDYFCDNEPT